MAAQQIGIVTQVVGQVVAVGKDGVERVLVVGDIVYADEVIRTADAGAVTIQFNDGGWFDLGRNAQAVLDSDVYSPEGHEAEAAVATAKVEDIQAAIERGEDPTKLLPATAAGPAGGAGGEGGHSFVALDHDFVSINPEAGIPTAAAPLTFTNTFDVLPPIEPDNGVQILDLTPAIDGGDATVFEKFLANGSEAGSGTPGDVGTFTLVAPDGVGSLFINGVQVMGVDGSLTVGAKALHDIIVNLPKVDELSFRKVENNWAEIKAGKYRGPLHGLPYGVKDLFNTK